jgi:predicted transcriptional regulator
MIDFLPNDRLSSSRQDLTSPSSVEVRGVIYDIVTQNPGIRYRELLRLAGISNGVLTYHLGILGKSGQIKVQRQSNKRVTRYYVSNISKRDSNIIGCIRSRVTRTIIIFILKNEYCTFNEIVEHVEKAPSTISWHIKRLKDMGILKVVHGSDRLLYTLTDKINVSNVLLKYKETFTDRIIDNYAEMVDKL